MKRGRRIGIAFVFLVSMLFLSIPQDVAATAPYFAVCINFADYGDLDGDYTEDDILILFTCVIGDGYPSPKESDFLFTLTVPSGAQYYALVTVIGRYRVIRLALSWFDSALEQGWYNVQLDAFGYGIYGGYDYDTYDFDPPTEAGGGAPTGVAVTFW
ncbi:MAG: hypothetical protein P1Q69_06380 [Candidatus Thorarchaeota archaeon]|nr:hypothetical protein [Candidatus Thorarchaeota archaeon]